MSVDVLRPRAADPAPGAGAGAASSDAVFHDAWSQALTDLELDVQECERLLASLHHEELPDVLAGPGSWSPPTHLGALPTSLAERARIVMANQLRVAEQLADAAVRSQQHLELQRRMRPDDAVSRPLFVDAAF